MGLTSITVRGARQHNLKNINVEIPRNTLTVVTGLSGSGKSSLAFDTIYAEGQRRYVETLSAYARQFLDQMERPDVDSIDGLSPSIAIEQKTTSRSPRSTVGTITEIYDYLRLLYSSIGVPHCPQCGRAISRQSADQIVFQVMALKPEERVMVMAPIVRGRKGEFKKELDKLVQQGFTRARIDGELRHIADEEIKLDKRKNHTIELVVDRLLVKPGIQGRLASAVELAMKMANGLVQVAVVGGEERLYSSKLACPDCGVNVPVLEPRSFSFNSMYGACPECNGLGSKFDFDPAKVITDWSKPLLDGALGPGSASQNLIHMLQLAAEAYGFSLTTPFEQLPRKTQDLILYGPDKSEKKRGGFLGVFAYLRRNMEDSSSRGLSRLAAGPHVGDDLSRVPGQTAAAGEPCGESEWHVHRRLHVVAGVTRRRGGSADHFVGARGTHSRENSQRDCRTPRLPQCRWTRLHLPQPLSHDLKRRRRPAHSAGHPDRLKAARRTLCPR